MGLDGGEIAARGSAGVQPASLLSPDISYPGGLRGEAGSSGDGEPHGDEKPPGDEIAGLPSGAPSMGLDRGTKTGRGAAGVQPAPLGNSDISYPSGLPDFDGLPLDRYLAPDLVLPLITAHGCYHGQCAFCSVGYGAGKGFHPLPVAQVLEQIIALHAKYGVRHIFFADEAIPPRTLRLLSEQLIERGAPVDWCGCARFEAALTEPLLRTMAAGGCRMLLFGLETGSERMIRHMVKGTQAGTMSRVLRDSARAGIWNHTFFFFGFPTEAMADAQETVNFLYEHQDALHSASPGVFVLERFSPIHADPARFGVKRMIAEPERDLAIYFDYEVEAGLDEELARTVYESLLGALPTKRYGQYYLHDANRFLYASHLHAQGKAFPLWLADEEAQ
jgi:radical SAM superfamily enzyme YgiQ (UPF0313 family)